MGLNAYFTFQVVGYHGKVIPESVKVASGVGIGLFLTTIGLSYGSGIGAITGSQATPVTLAGCPPQYLDPVTGICDGHLMQNPQVSLLPPRMRVSC
jgi:AGZA family xanthine/uracil permease-like MFS transporter